MDYYFDESGDRILTSNFLQKRGHCCKSSCLHCPYGHTIKTIGFEFRDFDNNKDLIKTTLNENGYNQEQNFMNDLLNEALNEKTKEVDIHELIHEGIQLIYLKNNYCGFITKESKKLFLNLHFKYQGITEEVVLSQLEQ